MMTFEDFSLSYSVLHSPIETMDEVIYNALNAFPFRSLVKAENLIKALCHSSFSHEYPKFSSYERLEFLGDAVLGLMTVKELYTRYPQMTEGELSRLKGAIVNEESLYRLGKIFELEKFILVGRGELARDGHKRKGVLADVVEAILGAAFLEGGTDLAEKVWHLMGKKYEEAFQHSFFSVERGKRFDPKSALQELTVAKWGEYPEYQGQEIEDGFEVRLYIKGQLKVSVKAKSKKAGEKACAEQYLGELQNAL